MNPSPNDQGDLASARTRLRRVTLLGVCVSVAAVWVTLPLFFWFPSTLTGFLALANLFGLVAMILARRHAKQVSSHTER
jgi:membrane glycosyltransferase